jgi:hypothetical protein
MDLKSFETIQILFKSASAHWSASLSFFLPCRATCVAAHPAPSQSCHCRLCFEPSAASPFERHPFPISFPGAVQSPSSSLPLLLLTSTHRARASPGRHFRDGHAWALLGASPTRSTARAPHHRAPVEPSFPTQNLEFFPITIFIGSKRPHRGCPLSGLPVPQLDARRPLSRAREALEQEAPRGTVSPGHTRSPKCCLRSSSRSARKIPSPRRHSNTPRLPSPCTSALRGPWPNCRKASVTMQGRGKLAANFAT